MSCKMPEPRITLLGVAFPLTLLAVTACELFAPVSGGANAPPAPSAEPAPPVPYTPPEPEPVASATSNLVPEPPVEPGVRQDSGPTRGFLPKAAIKEGVERGNSAYAACYQRSKRRGLRGTINVNFVIAVDGTVPHAAALEQGTSLEDEAVIECVLDAFKKLTFPAPSGGRAVATYPLNFEPLPE